MTQTYLEQIHNLLFRNDNSILHILQDIDVLGIIEDTYSQEKSVEIRQRSKDCIILFCKSVLSGEYIEVNNQDILKRLDSTSQNLKIEINERQEEISTQKEVLLANNKQQTSFSDLNRKAQIWDEAEKAIDDILIIIQHYKSLIEIFNDKINLKDRFLPIRINDLNQSSTNSLVVLFTKRIIPLCRFDYFPPITENEFHQLMMVYHYIDNITISNNSQSNKDNIPQIIFEIIKHKCNFLITKIKGDTISYSINQKEIKIQPEHLEIGNFTFFKTKSKELDDIDSCSTNHRDEWEQKIKRDEESLSDYVLLAKYYKNKETNLDKINWLIDCFERKYPYDIETNTPYDKYAIGTIKNYLYNSRFSLKYHNMGSLHNFDSMRSDLNEIEYIQKETKIKNYYPYLKAVEILLNRIKQNLEADQTNLQLIETKIDYIKEITPKLEDNNKWCKARSFFFFQLTQKESIITYNIGNEILNVLVPLSFSRIFNDTKINGKIAELKIGTDSISSNIPLLKKQEELLQKQKKTQEDIQLDKKEIEHIKKENKESQRRSFELLTILIVILTFLFGSISFSNSSINSGNLVEFTLSLGCILLLFTSAILFASPFYINEDLQFKKYLKTIRGKTFIFLFIIYFLILILCLLFNYNLQKPVRAKAIHQRLEIPTTPKIKTTLPYFFTRPPLFQARR